MSKILKPRCEEIGWDIIKKAEKLGEFREMVDGMEERLNRERKELPPKILKDPDTSNLLDLRQEEIKKRRYYIDTEEAALMDEIVKLVECERRD